MSQTISASRKGLLAETFAINLEVYAEYYDSMVAKLQLSVFETHIISTLLELHQKYLESMHKLEINGITTDEAFKLDEARRIEREEVSA